MSARAQLKTNPSPAQGVKFVLGILNKAGNRVSEVQSVMFDKAQWAVSDAKKWLKQQGFRIPSADEMANFFRFRQKSPARYKEMRTIEAGKHENPIGSGSPATFEKLATVGQYTDETGRQGLYSARLTTRDKTGREYFKHATVHPSREAAETWAKSKGHRIVNPEPICESLSGHLALTSDPFFQEQPPEIQAAMMTGMDLAEKVQNPVNSWLRNPRSVTPISQREYVAMTELANGHGRKGPDEFFDRNGNSYFNYEIRGHGPDREISLKQADRLGERFMVVSSKPSSGWKSGTKLYGVITKQMYSEVVSRAKRKRNPESDAAALSEKFHGRPPQQITTVTEEIEERDDFTELGDLVELKVATLSGYDVTLKFAQKGNQIVKLCSSPDGKQLYFIRGDQSVPLEQIHMGADKWKRDRMILGVLYELTYRTAKGFDKFKVCDYFHKLGEETKEQPMLEYDTLNDSLSVSGGQYRITARGIEN